MDLLSPLSQLGELGRQEHPLLRGYLVFTDDKVQRLVNKARPAGFGFLINTERRILYAIKDSDTFLAARKEADPGWDLLKEDSEAYKQYPLQE